MIRYNFACDCDCLTRNDHDNKITFVIVRFGNITPVSDSGKLLLLFYIYILIIISSDFHEGNTIY